MFTTKHSAASKTVGMNKQKRHVHQMTHMPLWMFSQRNNPYCVYPSNLMQRYKNGCFCKYLSEIFAFISIFL